MHSLAISATKKYKMLQQCATKREKVSFLAPTCANSIILVFSEKILDDTQGAFRVDESPFEALLLL